MIQLYHTEYIPEWIKEHTLEITCIPLFIAALFITNVWNQHRCPSVDRWMNEENVVYIYIHTTCYYSAIKKSKLCPLLENGSGEPYVKWNMLDLGKYLMFCLVWNLEIKKTWKRKGDSMNKAGADAHKRA
jgi:hypothetical protein